jgi:hypothetical protein
VATAIVTLTHCKTPVNAAPAIVAERWVPPLSQWSKIIEVVASRSKYAPPPLASLEITDEPVANVLGLTNTLRSMSPVILTAALSGADA